MDENFKNLMLGDQIEIIGSEYIEGSTVQKIADKYNIPIREVNDYLRCYIRQTK